MKIDDLSSKLLPELAIKQHDPLDSARWLRIHFPSQKFLLRRSFIILQNFCESNIVEKLLEKNTPMEKALEVNDICIFLNKI